MYICPQCGKFHLITPPICSCGYVFKKGTVKCKECGTLITPEREFCPNCKKSVWEMFSFACPNCKAKIGKGQRVCEKCGFLLIREVRKEEYVTRTRYICPTCGYELPTMNTPCPVCNR